MDTSKSALFYSLMKELKIKVCLLIPRPCVFQVYIAAIRNRNLRLLEDHTELYEIDKDKEAAQEAEILPHRDIFRFYPSL